MNQKQKFLQIGGLSAWEQAGISLLLLIALIFGVVVQCRATLTAKHNTDLGVYLAAAQAVRESGNLYGASYNFDHYMYPPFLAVLLAHVVPDPVAYGAPATVAFAVTVSLWYILSLVALTLAVSVLARTLSPPEPAAAKPAASTWRPIWTLRLLPIALCLHCLGRELQLGQVDIFLLALLAVMTACAAEGRSGQAGLWHAVAICLKVMPVILLVYPLWRRDWRWLLTCAGGMVIGLVLIPMLIVGPHKALKYTLAYNHKLVLPAITGNVTDHARDGEWFYQNAVHNYSIMGVLHNLENITLARDDRPLTVSVQDRKVAAFLGVLLLVTTLLASGFRRQVSRPTTILCLSMLTAVMLITSPVCQSYYFVLLIPLFMAVIAADLHQSGARFPRHSTLAVCVAYPAAQAISSFSPFLRDSGIVLAAVLALWLLALKTLNECRRESQSSD